MTFSRGKLLNWLIKSIWVQGVLIAVLSAPIGLMRLVSMLWAGHYHKILIPIVIMNSILGLLIYSTNGEKVRFNFLSICLLGAIFIGTTVGVLNLGSPRYFVSHFSAAIFMFAVFVFACNHKVDEQWLIKFTRKSSYAILWAFSIVLAIFWIINILFFSSGLYLGIGTGYLVLPLAYFIVTSNNKLAILSFMLILISGKRGPLISAIFVILSIIPFQLKKNILAFVGIVLFFCGTLFYLGIKTDGFTTFDSLPVFLSSPLQKISIINPNVENYDADLAYSGRNQEILLAVNRYLSSPLNPIIGMGYGWSYFFDAVIAGSTTTDFEVHYVHIAPVNFFLTLGIPLGLLIIGTMFYYFFKSYRILLSKMEKSIYLVYLLFWIGDFGNSLSGYSYPIDPLFWLSLALLATIPIRKSVKIIKK